MALHCGVCVSEIVPPLPRLKTEPLRELATQLRYAPREALLRDLERAEALARQIESELSYPEDFVIYRVTGYRPELDEPAVIPGDVLLADLPALVEHLCAAADLRAEELPEGVPADDLAERWRVSRKTLSRYRKHGLVARRVRGEDDRPRLVFCPEMIEAFERAQEARIERAGAFSRVDPDLERRIISRARRYRRLFGVTLNQTSARLAERFGRSQEAVRQLLRRHDERAAPGEAIFTESGPLSPRARELAYRAWRRAAEPGQVASRVSKPVPAVLRVINERRGEALRRVLPTIVHGLDGGHGAEVGAVLSEAGVRGGLGIGVPTTLGGVLDAAEQAAPPDRDLERVRALAFASLRARAAAAIEALPRYGARATELDRIETDLRWASRLKAELVRSHLGVARRSLEDRLARPLSSGSTVEVERLVLAMLSGIAEGIDRFHARSSGRLAAPVGLAVDRAVRETLELLGEADKGTGGRARPMFQADASIGDWSSRLSGWQALTEPDARVRPGLVGLGERGRRLLLARFGWVSAGAGVAEGGEPPRTLAEIADAEGREVVHLARSERAAIRRAVAFVRSSHESTNGTARR